VYSIRWVNFVLCNVDSRYGPAEGTRRWAIGYSSCFRGHDLSGKGFNKIKVEVFWLVTPCSVVVGYQRFRGPCCLHLHPLKRWYPTTTLNGVTNQKTSTWNVTSVKAPKLSF